MLGYNPGWRGLSDECGKVSAALFLSYARVIGSAILHRVVRSAQNRCNVDSQEGTTTAVAVE